MNTCPDCGKPRVYSARLLEPEEWCACPAGIAAREAFGRMLLDPFYKAVVEKMKADVKLLEERIDHLQKRG